MSEKKSFFREWIIPIAVAVILSLLIKEFVFFNINVPSGSMEPTIKPGDRIFVTRVYNPDKLKRGDIVVFYSKELKENLIKRLIGLPGDTVEVKSDGSVYVNGNKLSEPYVSFPGQKTGNFKVPKDSYLFLGDNRADSLDSRYWQNPYIYKSDIKGLARFTFYPFNRFGSLR